MHRSTLKPFVRRDLDVLFVALNAPAQSNSNGHWFSGSGSRFYKLLAHSGLTIEEVPRDVGDELVFGSVERNHQHASFGVIDLVSDWVETDSSKVRPTLRNAERLLDVIRQNQPRFVCVLHAKVRDALNKSGLLRRDLVLGANGPLLEGCRSEFFLNHFPNGNNIKGAVKIDIFRQLKEQL